ncbi:Tudor and KH domain-containing protein-like protein [Formica fusca]
MRWISNLDRKFVVPILIGISLTTLSCISLAILFYPVFEKDDDTRDDSNNTKRSRKIITSRCTTVQYKVPKQFASAIIGRGGSVIQKIQDTTGTHITMSKNDIESPDRVCIIQGNEMEGIRLAESMIKNIIDNQPIIETYELFVPYEACGNFGILKRNGDTVQQIQRSSGAKLIMENSGVYKSEAGWKRRIIIKGTAEQIALAVTQIEDKVREESEAQAQLKCETATARTPRISPSKNSVKDIMDNQPTIETYEFSVPYQVCGRIIGRNGNTIQQIQRFSGAEIVIEKDLTNISQNNERCVMLRGTAEQIALAVTQIKDKIQEENETQIDLNDDFTITVKRTPTFEPSLNNGVNMSDNTSETSQISLPQEDVMEVYVSAMETPNIFWIHVIGPGNTALDNLIFEMTEYYNKEENREFHALKKITPGQMVAAKFSYDNKWYRAEIITIVGDSQCEVYYVDYGDIDIISTDDVLELCTDMLSLRLQAVECSLANTKPRESEWSREACDKFAELVQVAQWKPLIAKVKGYKKRPIGYGKSRREGSPIPCIDLYDKDGDMDINIKETLIRLELAQFEEEVCSTASSTLSQNKHDFPVLSSPLVEHVSNDCRGKADFTTSTCRND